MCSSVVAHASRVQGPGFYSQVKSDLTWSQGERGRGAGWLPDDNRIGWASSQAPRGVSTRDFSKLACGAAVTQCSASEAADGTEGLSLPSLGSER